MLARKNIRITEGYYFEVGVMLTLPVLLVTLAALTDCLRTLQAEFPTAAINLRITKVVTAGVRERSPRVGGLGASPQNGCRRF